MRTVITLQLITNLHSYILRFWIQKLLKMFFVILTVIHNVFSPVKLEMDNITSRVVTRDSNLFTKNNAHNGTSYQKKRKEPKRTDFP